MVLLLSFLNFYFIFGQSLFLIPADVFGRLSPAAMPQEKLSTSATDMKSHKDDEVQLELMRQLFEAHKNANSRQTIESFRASLVRGYYNIFIKIEFLFLLIFSFKL
jgi:hypothetical protein